MNPKSSYTYKYFLHIIALILCHFLPSLRRNMFGQLQILATNFDSMLLKFNYVEHNCFHAYIYISCCI